jgi:predicted RNA methylase
VGGVIGSMAGAMLNSAMVAGFQVPPESVWHTHEIRRKTIEVLIINLFEPIKHTE